MNPEPNRLPPSQPFQTYVQISPIFGGHLTLPDSAFVSPADPKATRYVPSLSFLVTHPGLASPPENNLLPQTSNEKPLRLLFDLGLRQQASDYMEPQQKHLETRRPYQLFPGVPEYLRRGGVAPKSEIDVVVLSHVHYDHHGDPEEFSNARFLVGSGALDVLKNGLGEGLGSHQYFKADLLPERRTRELPPPAAGEGWQELGPFPHALDLFEDGSVYVLDMPGHLPGHVNLLCRVGEGRWVCLCGDAFHDPRLLSGEKEIGTWEGEGGRICCIHVDRERAEKSIEKLRKLREMGDVELVAAHDDGWARKNEERFFPNHL